MVNDNWKDTQESEILATGIPPENDRESAILATLAPGKYTALQAGKNGTSGNGLIEVYDLEPGTDSMLVNVSTRGFVGSADNAMIGGVVIGGNDDSLVVLRAIGPSLAGAITDPLLDPAIELHDVNGALTGLNDNWRDGHLQAVQAQSWLPPMTGNLSSLLSSARAVTPWLFGGMMARLGLLWLKPTDSREPRLLNK